MSVLAIQRGQLMIFYPKTEWFSRPGLAVVVMRITCKCQGQIKHAATYWRAELATPHGDVDLPPDTVVTVVGKRGLVLLVSPSLAQN